MKSFSDLKAWQEGHKLVLLTYKLTRSFPKEEMFGIISQMRRCAVSVMSNIAEGFSRRNSKEKSQFYYIAIGSLTELQNQLVISRDLGYLSKEEFNKAAQQSILVQKLTNGLVKSSKTL